MRQRYNRDGQVDYTNVRRLNETWVDHVFRTNVTAGLIASLKPTSAMDPACGDGSILLAAAKLVHIPALFFGDVSVPNIDAIPQVQGIATNCGDILDSFEKFPRVNVVVLTEILEHLPDPDLIVREARAKGDFLLASSPVIEANERDDNPEHLWGFDEEGYAELLSANGWQPFVRNRLTFRDFPYIFQFWIAR